MGLHVGIQIIPTMPVQEVIEIAVAAEALGYDYCLLADEGFMADVYVALGAIAQRTTRIKVGPVTNGYTRHPAVTANALATLDDLSGGRALAVLVAGGSMVLNPMGIPREAPLTVVRESVEVMRRLWSGEAVTWQGQRYRLQEAQLSGRRLYEIPVWLAARGEKMLALAARTADGVVLVAKSDLGPALAIMAQADGQRTERMVRVYMDRIAYSPELLAEASDMYAFVLMDMPQRMLDGLGIGAGEIERIRSALATVGPAAAARLVRPEIIQRSQVAGTPAECCRALQEITVEHRLDVVIMNLTTPGVEANTHLLRAIAEIVRCAGQ